MYIPEKNIYPCTGDTQTIYLNSVIINSNINIGGYTMYNDFINNPINLERNNVLYYYPVNHDKLIIGKFCSIPYLSGLLGIMKDGDILEVEGDIVWQGCMECCKM